LEPQEEESRESFRLMRRLLLALRATLSYAAGIVEKLHATHKDVQAGAMRKLLRLKPQAAKKTPPEGSRGRWGSLSCGAASEREAGSRPSRTDQPGAGSDLATVQP
jgi:hypothetical protein